MAVAFAIFVLSLLCICFLFAQKSLEVSRGRPLLPEAKSRLDAYAAHAKMLLERAGAELERLPPKLVRLLHNGIRQGALAAAGAARSVERELHRIADMVSHKRSFSPREPRNEFLKQVGERKGNNGDGGNGATTV